MSTDHETRGVTINVKDGVVSKFYPSDEQAINGALDYAVTITMTDRVVVGGITLYRDPINNRMSPMGSPIDVWCSDTIVMFLRTLTEWSATDLTSCLACGPGVEALDLDFVVLIEGGYTNQI